MNQMDPHLPPGDPYPRPPEWPMGAPSIKVDSSPPASVPEPGAGVCIAVALVLWFVFIFRRRRQ